MLRIGTVGERQRQRDQHGSRQTGNRTDKYAKRGPQNHKSETGGCEHMKNGFLKSWHGKRKLPLAFDNRFAVSQLRCCHFVRNASL